MVNKGFSDEERRQLLTVKGVGETVVSRLEQMGIDNLAQLGDSDPDDILAGGAAITGSSCWQNSPQAKAAIRAAVDFAKTHTAP